MPKSQILTYVFADDEVGEQQKTIVGLRGKHTGGRDTVIKCSRLRIVKSLRPNLKSASQHFPHSIRTKPLLVDARLT